MKIQSDSIQDGQPIAAKYAMGKPDSESHATFSDNISPHIGWSDLPEGTKSLVLICTDVDAPTKPDDVNQEGKTVPADLPRADFQHWVLVDLPPDGGDLQEGEFCKGVTPKGKDAKAGPRGTRQGLNDYTGWFSGDADMEGKYFGYDGPFPPWNDERVHNYRFTLFALDVERCPVEGEFTAKDVLDALDGHILGEAAITGSYTLNPDAKG